MKFMQPFYPKANHADFVRGENQILQPAFYPECEFERMPSGAQQEVKFRACLRKVR